MVVLCVTAFSYMDNVPVKISEQFKPPRKVTLPVSFQHWLSSEKLTREVRFVIVSYMDNVLAVQTPEESHSTSQFPAPALQ